MPYQDCGELRSPHRFFGAFSRADDLAHLRDRFRGGAGVRHTLGTSRDLRIHVFLTLLGEAVYERVDVRGGLTGVRFGADLIRTLRRGCSISTLCVRSRVGSGGIRCLRGGNLCRGVLIVEGADSPTMGSFAPSISVLGAVAVSLSWVLTTVNDPVAIAIAATDVRAGRDSFMRRVPSLMKERRLGTSC